MARKEKLQGSRKREDGDTTPYAQPWGTAKKGTQNQRQMRMPHERDESASSTGNRLDQDPPPDATRMNEAVADLEAGREDTDRRGVPDDIPTERRGKR